MSVNAEFNSGAVRPVDCVTEGWNLFTQNLGLLLLIGLLTILLVGCLGIVVIGWFLYGPIMVGIFYVYLRQMRGEQVEFGMMFHGFKYFLPAMLVGLLMNAPSIAGWFYDRAFQIAQLLALYNPNELSAGLLTAIWAFSFIFKSIVILLSITAYILLLFSFPLFAERKMGLMDTMKLSAKAGKANAGGLFLLMLLNGLIIIVGILACFVGIIFAVPLVFAANAVAYRQVFPDSSAPQTMTPPQPEQYGFQQ